MDKDSIGRSLKESRSLARIFGIMSAILLGIYLLVPIKIVKGFALLFLALAGWQFLFYGATAISIVLKEKSRQRFQIFVSVVVPILMSLYFIKDVPSINLEGIAGHLFSVWFLVILGILASISWGAANYLEKDHPFRGFLIACTVIFVICIMGHNGIYSEYDDYSESSSMFMDKEAAKRAAETGRYFGQFLVYVLVTYAAMYLKIRRKRAHVNPQTPNI